MGHIRGKQFTPSRQTSPAALTCLKKDKENEEHEVSSQLFSSAQ